MGQIVSKKTCKNMISAPIATPQVLYIPSNASQREIVHFPGFFLFSSVMFNIACLILLHSPQWNMGFASCFYCVLHLHNVFVPPAAFSAIFFCSLASLVKRFGSFLLPALPASLSFDFCYCISKRNSTHNSLIFLNPSLYTDPSWSHCMECSVSTVSTFDLAFEFHWFSPSFSRWSFDKIPSCN